ncbi:GTP-binding protein [Hydrogenivirga sp. 128-5-R1-1]|uniref:GTP-binding protein n=1 Tax=Hydrogenivirga sp. 128-5-R1-1 TaxID=392423 RepID=UPI00015F0CB4|nr:GTP-binding protein [Hydrogenivirga sp. 128-5-R1-1]EDP75913.1 gliding motility protein [Hydrogenivirga sp. 128-5-R1-1]
MLIDSSKGIVRFKVVYHGIAMSGKTTNIEQLAKQSGLDVLSFDTKEERTLVFDFITKKLKVDGFTLTFSIYTIPGQDIYKDIRKMVMRGVDAVVFVVDSSERRLSENKEFVRTLGEDLRQYGKDIEGTPIVVQYNKRDLPDALPIDVLKGEVSIPGKRSTEAVAVRGEGVTETFDLIVEELMEKFRKMVG